ncbi:MAG: IclR family transcriptional regulator, partial [Micromonosporaceae bacterium]
IQAVTRAAQVLRLFGPDTPELTAGEAAAKLRLNRTTAYRYCTSLAAAGLLERGHRPGSFIPGPLLLQLGVFALGRRRVMDLAPPHLHRLRMTAEHTAVLSLWGGAGAVVARVEEDPGTVVITVRVGTQLPLDAAQSQLFLAWHPDQPTISRILAAQPADSRHALEARLAQVRAIGYAYNTAVSPGVLAIAAPVFDEYGICATLALVGTDKGMAADDSSTQVLLLKQAAHELSKELGWAHS